MKKLIIAASVAALLTGCTAGSVGIGGGTGGVGLGAGLSFPIGGEKADTSITETSYYAAFREDAIRAVSTLEGYGDECRMNITLNRDGSVKLAHRTSKESEFCDAAVETIEGTQFAPPPVSVTDQQIKTIPLNLK